MPPAGSKHDNAVNRESAFDILTKRANEKVAAASVAIPAPKAPAPASASSQAEAPPSRLDEFLWGTKRRQGAVEAAAKSATRTVANGLGRQILRGLLGGLLGGRR